MIELFHYDDKRDELIFDSELIRTVPCFRKLWRRLQKIKGDSDGSDKLGNKREMQYVFYMANWTRKNPYYALDEIEKANKAKEACEMDPKWVPDELVQECINYYIEYTIKYTPTAKFVNEVEVMIMQAADFAAVLRKANQQLLSNVESQMSGVMTSGDEAAALSVAMVQLSANISSAFKLMAEIEAANKRRAALSKQLKEEEEQTINITGGKAIGNRENPN